MPELDADIIVIGGGPAGSTAATMLARKGHRVLLFEKETFPREHIGESLLPASLPVLEELGVLADIEAAGFLKKWGATMVWGSGSEPWSWYFRETNKTHPHAYQVFRPEFDRLLLQNSARHGVDVRQNHRVLEVSPLAALSASGAPTPLTVRYQDADGIEHNAIARFVVDASGQSGLIGRTLGIREPDENFQNLATYGYFEGCERLPAPDETNILIESYEHGWFWLIPLHNGQMSVGAVVDHRYGSEAIRAQGLDAYFRAQVAAAPNAARMLANATLVAGPTVIRDWSYQSRDLVADGWILAGDAACFIDPLFSTGVHLALSAGVLASAYVTTALKDPAMAVPAAAVYRELYYGQYNLFRQLAGLFYATNRTVDSYFWEARRIMGFGEDLPARAAFIRAVAGQPPKGYERVVLERGEAPEGLVSGIRQVTEERAARRAVFEALVQQPGAGGTALHGAIPVPDSNLRLERKPVLGEGEFTWGYVVSTEARPEGTAVSTFIARLLELCDGVRPVSVVLARLAADTGATPAALTGPVISALGILYADGAIASLA